MKTALLLLAACGADIDAPVLDTGEPDPALSELGASVVAALRDKHGDSRGRAWSVAGDDALEPGWILQTPPAQYWGQPATALPVTRDCTGDAACDPDFGLIACTSQADCRFGGTCTSVAATVARPGDAPRKLCTGHSDEFVDAIYGVIVGAQQYVDLASLEAPDGRFEAAVRNALAFLARSGRSVRVRLLYAAVPTRTRDTGEVLASLVRDVDASSALRVGVGALRETILAWNHSKLVAADGQTAIVGGHNMWTRHYLQSAPVHDLSMKLSGTAAADASRFVNELWSLTCGVPPLGGSTSISNFPLTGDVCEDRFEATSALAASRGTVPVITVGKLGGSYDDDEGQDAILALLDAAHTHLRLSLQDIGADGKGTDWPDAYLRALDAALVRGVDIELVMTNLGARPDGLGALSASYSNGWTPGDVAGHLIDYAAAHPDVTGGADIRALACAQLHITTLRQGPDDTWPDGSTFANHAKLAIADDAAFYLGSQNWYPAMLSELGYIVDDATATRELVDTYFAPMWAASSRGVLDTCAP